MGPINVVEHSEHTSTRSPFDAFGPGIATDSIKGSSSESSSNVFPDRCDMMQNELEGRETRKRSAQHPSI
jgi:hypothetical protein